MDSLPPELISLIASHLERNEDEQYLSSGKLAPSKLPPYAVISRQWQYAIERRTFHRLSVKSTELNHFSRMVTGHRRAIVAQLSYQIVLPAYEDFACAKYENNKDKEVNNREFTSAIQRLFRLLKFWEQGDGGGVRQTITLMLSDIYSPMDGAHRGEEKYKEDMWNFGIGKRPDLWHHRYQHSFLTLLNSNDLPVLSQISCFMIYPRFPRSIEPRSITAIASKLSNLRTISWAVNGNEKKHHQLHQDRRYGTLHP